LIKTYIIRIPVHNAELDFDRKKQLFGTNNYCKFTHFLKKMPDVSLYVSLECCFYVVSKMLVAYTMLFCSY